MAPDALQQAAILILILALFYLLQNFPKQALTRLRARNRTVLQTNRHFLNGAQLLSRAKSTKYKTTSISLAKDAVSEADKALALNPKDAGSHILKALCLDLMGHKTSALKSLDSALSPPAVKSLGDRERGDALFKRGELLMTLNRSRRVDSVVADLVDSVRLSPGNDKALCLLGECYELKGLTREAKLAYEEAIKIEPASVKAWDGLARFAT